MLSLWGGSKVALIDPVKGVVLSTIPVGSHPNDMTLTKNGKYLFVAQANDNSVSVINTETGKVVEVFSSALYPDSPAGSTTNAVALSEDESRLYIANADNNCLAVFNCRASGWEYKHRFYSYRLVSDFCQSLEQKNMGDQWKR